MSTLSPKTVLFVIAGLLAGASVVTAQSLTQRGFVDGSVFVFPLEAPNDATQLVGDLLVREEVVLKPSSWIQFSAGADLRANSHDQVDDSWAIDLGDRGTTRPRVSVRRLAATLTHGPFTIDAGKQFIRWGKADIVNPTDRFAPRDYLNVVDPEFLGVSGVRGVAQVGDDTFEVVWVPRLTPSRVPLVDQRWTVVPEVAAGFQLVDGGAEYPSGAQAGARWGHVGAGVEYSLSFYNGFNHLPNIHLRAPFDERAAPDGPVGSGAAISTGEPSIGVTRTYPQMRMYGADAALPTRWFTVKGEIAYFTSSSPGTDEYVLYVAQLERQTGEWVMVGGYAGEAVTVRRSTLDFAPDRGMTRSFIMRASYTIDTRRSVAIEGAVRQNGDGAYARVEYSQARGQHWRATLSAVGIAGDANDFLGQYRRNSHVKWAVRYSF